MAEAVDDPADEQPVPNGSELYIKYILYIVQNGSERFRTIYTARTNPNYFELLRTNPN